MGAALAAFASVTGCGGEPPDPERVGDPPPSATVGLSPEMLDPTGGAPEAGISAGLRPRLDPLDPDELHGDTASRRYHAFRQRCGGCHRPPSPSSKPPSEWPDVVRRMESHVGDAGLLPFSDGERAAIRRFLLRHARGRE